MLRERNKDNIAILNIVFYAIFTLLISNIVALVVTFSIKDITMSEMLAYTNGITFLLLSIVLFIISKPLLKENFKKHKFKTIITKALLVAAAVYVTSIALGLLYQYGFNITETSDNQAGLIEMLKGTSSTAMILVFVSVLGPFCEELVFRYSLIQLFEKKFSKVTCIILSSFFFGLIHVIQTFDMLYLLLYMSLGIVLAYFYYRYNKNIWITIFAHVIYNSISVILLLL